MTSSELECFENYLLSPYHNTRVDILHLFRLLRNEDFESGEDLTPKEVLFSRIYPKKIYSNLEMNNLVSYLTAEVRSFLALENWKSKPEQESIYLLHALRDHQLDHQFERNWQNLHERHQASRLRNASWFMFEYHLQNELFKYRTMKDRTWPENLQTTTDALTKAFALETMRWNSTAISQQNATGQSAVLPLAGASEAYLRENLNKGAFALFQQSDIILQKNSSPVHFAEMRSLMYSHINELSLEESREIYLSAINFCIRQINQGDRSYMNEAFTLYKEALESRALLDRGTILQTHTYYNVHVLAHRVGEREWAKTFLDKYQKYLPKAERNNFYQYNLAIYSFMLEDYPNVLGILVDVHFNELYLNLEVRLMMLRAYFETRQINSLESLLSSFSLFVRRHKELGANKDRYLNLIKFTRKLLKIHLISKSKRIELLNLARETKALSDKEWVVKKLEGAI